MGMRSQIYVRIDGELKIASYYQWNFGERMISRARWGIESIIKDLDYPCLFQTSSFIEKLRRIFDVNFDYKDIVMSHDLLTDPDESEDVFNSDNNNGKLLVAVDTKAKTVKYALTDCGGKPFKSPAAYMEWDGDEPQLEKEHKENMEWLEANVPVMTEEEAEAFQRMDAMEIA